VIKAWIFEFMHAPAPADTQSPQDVKAVFDANMALWEDVDRLGYEGIFFSEHHFMGQSYSPSPNLLVAAIAQRTHRLRLGVMGMVLPFYQPWRVLEEIGMLDHLTGGRLEVGLAAGIPQELGRVALDHDEARGRFDEILQIVDAGLSGAPVTHRGKYWQFEDLQLSPRPLQQPAPPVWTTVVSDGSARASAARRTKICTGFQSVARISEIFDAYRVECERHGRPATPDDLAIRRNVTIAEDAGLAREMDEIARETARAVMAGDTRVASAKSLLDAPAKGAGFTVDDQEFVSGTPDEVAEIIVEQCRGCGAGHFLATMARGSHDRRAGAVRLFGERVVPVLRRAEIVT
jgi:alkanesulfonate monooxygenase SsuD/methylene tetrahydromethanopterin reductase-like flavin-dependent oxidoreductase (luciferase family)